MKVVLASKNPHKLVEIDAITRKLGIELILQSELGVDIDVEETGTTFEENSFLKANAVMQATGLPAMADDSGIVVDALNGEPGVYSARYGGDPTMTDHDRKMLLLKNTVKVPTPQSLDNNKAWSTKLATTSLRSKSSSNCLDYVTLRPHNNTFVILATYCIEISSLSI